MTKNPKKSSASIDLRYPILFTRDCVKNEPRYNISYLETHQREEEW
jgi:hypothetical protein